MGFHTGQVTLDASIQNLASALGITDRQPATEITFYNIAGNGVVNVGGPEHASTLSATIHGFQVLAAAADALDGIVKIGPFSSSGAPLNLADVYLLGTNNNLLGVTWVTP